MSDEQHPRPWTVNSQELHVLDASGLPVLDASGDRWPSTQDDGPDAGLYGLSRGVILAALVGAVNAADRALPLETVLANLAAGRQ